ncbi:hypothetical protein HPB51_021160 [Rhipicephalus microplus]|uniref:Uncharacterized protein n=1 Tax=Rhipicephalus microplus TaxID=6941 RepID=A0A9J6F696_RHIMP|nr:hypothetical protein HPB51_021160 [Rhipicephalus microplus]
MDVVNGEEGGEEMRHQDKRDPNPGSSKTTRETFRRCRSVGFFPGVKEKRGARLVCRPWVGGLSTSSEGRRGVRWGPARGRLSDGVGGGQQRSQTTFCVAAAAAATPGRRVFGPLSRQPQSRRRRRERYQPASPVTRAKWSGKNTTRCQRAATERVIPPRQREAYVWPVPSVEFKRGVLYTPDIYAPFFS